MPIQKQVQRDPAGVLEHIRHSLAHLLAAAVMELWPDAKRAIGPAIDGGFYFDFDFSAYGGNADSRGTNADKRGISEKDLPKIEKKMREILPTWDAFTKHLLTAAEAKKEYPKNPYKHELIDEFSKGGKKVSFYKSGAYWDLCKGGHVESAKEIKPDAFKLDRIAGAYWRGDEKNTMLTRIYGLAFETKAELEHHLHMREEAEKRDHRKLGKQLDLFTFSEYVGSGLPLYTPRGALIRKTLNEYIEDLQAKAGYAQLWTPQIVKAELFKISGHYDKYKDDMFRVISNYSKEEFFLKPMNCPQHTQMYAREPHSYRNLPIRYTDFAMLYRDEKPGELSGLARVRSFSQDDCHIFCTEGQIDAEMDTALRMTKEVMKTFGFTYRYRLSTRDKKHPEKYLGDPTTWDKVEKWTERILRRNGIEYFESPGEAAFYAPKMDLLATDVLGREWQLSTLQIDFVMPKRFKLVYVDADGKEKTPVMLHRAIIGSSERFLMILIEHFAGAFPLWLAPVQAVVIPVSEKLSHYAIEVAGKLKEAGIRVEIADANETLGKRIREAEMQKIPYVLVVGEKEKAAGTVNVRRRGSAEAKAMANKQDGEMKTEKLIEKMQKEITEKDI